MKYFSKEDIEKLREYEYYFTTTVKYGYKRNTVKQVNEYIADIYDSATSEKINRNFSCNKCVFDMFTTVGKLYFASIEYHKNNEENNVPEPLKEEEPTTIKEDEKKTVKKAGRPKKQTTK